MTAMPTRSSDTARMAKPGGGPSGRVWSGRRPPRFHRLVQPPLKSSSRSGVGSEPGSLMIALDIKGAGNVTHCPNSRAT